MLQPLARIIIDADFAQIAQKAQTSEPLGSCLIVYPHCKFGNLSDWVSSRNASAQPIGLAEAARVVYGVLLGVEVLLHRGSCIVSAVQADEIFIDEFQVPRVREPLAGTPGGWRGALKWLSPDEAVGCLHGTKDPWPALAFRLGLLLYCMNVGEHADPYPHKTGEMVLVDLLREAHGEGPPVRPDMCAYNGPDIMCRLVTSCFQIGRQEPPSRLAFAKVLESVSMAGNTKHSEIVSSS